MENVQIEKIKLNGDELPFEIKRTRPPGGAPEVVVVTGASAGVGRVAWSKVEADYRKRPTNDEIRAALDSLR